MKGTNEFSDMSLPDEKPLQAKTIPSDVESVVE